MDTSIVYSVTTSLSVGEALQNTLMNPVALAVDDLRDQYLREMALVRQNVSMQRNGVVPPELPACAAQAPPPAAIAAAVTTIMNLRIVSSISLVPVRVTDA